MLLETLLDFARDLENVARHERTCFDRLARRVEWLAVSERTSESNGAPGGSRTPGLQVRSLSLYPAELRARAGPFYRFAAISASMARASAVRRRTTFSARTRDQHAVSDADDNQVVGDRARRVSSAPPPAAS